MIFPRFGSVKADKVMELGAFGGYNNTPSCKAGEFSSMKNLSSKNYPALSPVSEMIKVEENVADIFLYDGTVFKITLDGELYAGGKKVAQGLSTGEREFAVLGKYLIMMPEGAYYHLETGVYGSLGAQWQGVGRFCKGAEFGDSLTVNTLKSEGANFEAYFSAGDCVEVTDGENNYGFYVISDIKRGYIMFENAEFAEMNEDVTFILKRKIPELKNTFECNNRIWGNEGDVIYASALGDPFNFYKYRGISTDSYFKEIYSGGNFTAGIAYGETPLFFKENAIYRVYGTAPEDFHVDVKEAPGVSESCAGSVAVLDGGVFYAGTDGIYYYTSAYPVKISEKLGNIKVGSACGGTDGRRYFVSFSEFYGVKPSMSELIKELHEVKLHAYDIENRCWYKYDDTLRLKKIVTGAYGSTFRKNNTLALDRNGTVFTLSDKAAPTVLADVMDYPPMPVESYGVSGVIDVGAAARLHTLRFTAKISEAAELYVDISFDGGEFERVCLIKGDGKERTYSFRACRKRFSFCRLRVGGRGEYMLRDMQIYYSPSRSRER